MFGETAELKTPYAQLLDSWLKRSDKSVGEVASCSRNHPGHAAGPTHLTPVSNKRASEQAHRRGAGPGGLIGYTAAV